MLNKETHGTLVALLFAAAMLLTFFRLGAVPLFDVDEAVFSQASKEMYLSGDFITPTYNGENRFDKPILFYWLMAGSYALFGINEFAARFPSALAGMLLVLSVYFFMLHARPEEGLSPPGSGGALLAAAALVLSLFFTIYSRAAVTDMVLTLFISLSLFSFYFHTRGKRRIFIYGFYFFSALAFLTKGLVGVAFPFGAALIYSWLEEGFSLAGALKRVFDWKGALLFIIAGLPWYAAEVAINGDEFIRLFIIKHHFERYVGVISGHSGPIWYYLPVLFIGFFPWSAFLPSGVRKALKEAPQEALKERNSPSLFALVWFLLVFVFFSFSRTKLPNYILPALPAAAILAAEGMKGGSGRKMSLFSNVFLSVLSLVLAVALAGAGYYMGRHQGIFLPVPVSTAPVFAWLYFSIALILGVALTGLFGAFFKNRKFYPGAAACLMSLFLFTLVSKALPFAGNEVQGVLRDYSLYAGEHLGEKGVLACFRMNNPSVVFYSGKRVVSADDPAALRALAEKTDGGLFVIARSRDLDKMGAPPLVMIKNEGGYAFFEKKAEKN